MGLGLKRSRDFFERALRLDPNFAAAWASLADAYSTLAFTTQMRPHEAMPKAKQAAERALSLDDSLSSAHGAMA
jgi:serine/threonine-protein kinase